MSKITALEVQVKDKSRANLYLDDEFFAGVSIELVVKHQLKKDMEVDEKFLADIIFEDDKGKALSKAIKYMGSNIKSCSQIREYLRKKEYAPEIIDYVIDKMKGLSEFFIKHLITIKIIVIFAKNPINIQHLHFSMEVWYNICC